MVNRRVTLEIWWYRELTLHTLITVFLEMEYILIVLTAFVG